MLEREAASFQLAGSRTLILTPNDAVMQAAEGFPRQRPGAAHDIVGAARRQTMRAFETFEGRSG